jgi:hypothetical protein
VLQVTGLQGRADESVLSRATAALSLLRSLESAAGIQPDTDVDTGPGQPIIQGARRAATSNAPPQEGNAAARTHDDGSNLEEIISPQDEEDSLRLVQAAACRNRKLKEFLHRGRDVRSQKTADSQAVVLQFSAKNNAMRKYLMECKSNRDREVAIPSTRVPRSQRSRPLVSSMQSDHSHLEMDRNGITGMYTTEADMFPDYQTVQVPTPRMESALASTESKISVLAASFQEAKAVLRAGSGDETLVNIRPFKSVVPTPVRSAPSQQREPDVEVQGFTFDSVTLQHVKSRRSVQRSAAPRATVTDEDANSRLNSSVNRAIDTLPLMTVDGSGQEYFGGIELQSAINPSSQRNAPPSPLYSAQQHKAPRATRAAAPPPGSVTSNTPMLSHVVSPSNGPIIPEGPRSAPRSSVVASDGSTMLARPAPVLLPKTPRETPILRASGMPQRASAPEGVVVHASTTTQQVAEHSKTINEGPAPRLLVKVARRSQDEFMMEDQQVSKGPVSSEDMGVNLHEEELPEDWEMKFDLTKGKYFYINHDLQVLSWVRPRARVALASPIKVQRPDQSMIVSSVIDRSTEMESVSMYDEYRVVDYPASPAFPSPSVAQPTLHGSPLSQHVMTPPVGRSWNHNFAEDLDVSPPFLGGSLLDEEAGDSYQNMSDSINVPQEVENELRQKLQEVMGDDVRYRQQQKEFVDNLMFVDLDQAVDEGGALIC